VVKINDVSIGSPATSRRAAPAVSMPVEPPAGAPVTTSSPAPLQVKDLQLSVAAGENRAAANRVARLHQLAEQVRSGVYRPSSFELASQIVAQAELNTRLGSLA
jgi:hypothetical protein